MLDFENEDFTIPPSFSHKLLEESLKDDEHLFVLWATLKIPMPENPGWVADAMFDCLANCIKAAGKEDKTFMVFPYNLSNYKSVSDLPPGVVDLEGLLVEINDWLHYFPQAKPRAKGSNVYTVLLIGLSMPFILFIKKLSPWCKQKKFGLWEASLQSEKPVSIGWLLFSTNSMDLVLFKEQIAECIQDIPVGLCWKMINMGTQGKVKEEDQVQVLHLFIDELNIEMAKPLLMALYESHPSADHVFPLHIQMQLVPEIDTVFEYQRKEKHLCLSK